jgi:hypothetical protein
MSEKIYACLLRLYPSHFREAYGAEALLLFRDRARDERGFFLRVRLWLDVLADLTISVPREYYYYLQPALAGASAQQRFDGTPLFRVLEGESPRLGTLLLGGILSLVLVGAFAVLNSHVGSLRPFLEAPETQPTPQDMNSATLRAIDEDVKPDAAERRRVIDAVAANLREHYIDRDVARKMADAMLAHEKSGEDGTVTDGRAFADLLTRQMRDVSEDLHLEVVYSRERLPDQSQGPTPERLASYRKAMEQNHCTFEKVEILPHNIGYLKLNSFPDPSICQPTATAAMDSLNNADAIIFDLRDNTGGYPGSTALIAAYLFDHPEYWYSPREETTQQSWTRSPVPGNRLADKPVYVLTSASTWSGAEQFCYDLKMLKRATLVGETTRGGAHAGVFHRIDDHFGVAITEVRAINPFSKTDWRELAWSRM